MLGISCSIHFIIAQLSLINDTARLSEWLGRAPQSCGIAETMASTRTCIDDVCKQSGKIRNPNADVFGLAHNMASNLSNPGLKDISRAVNAGLVDHFKDDFCMDPPSNGLMQRDPFTLPVPAMESATARNMLFGLAAALGALAIRATQTATGGFFLFTIPEKRDHYRDGI